MKTISLRRHTYYTRQRPCTARLVHLILAAGAAYMSSAGPAIEPMILSAMYKQAMPCIGLQLWCQLSTQHTTIALRGNGSNTTAKSLPMPSQQALPPTIQICQHIHPHPTTLSKQQSTLIPQHCQATAGLSHFLKPRAPTAAPSPGAASSKPATPAPTPPHRPAAARASPRQRTRAAQQLVRTSAERAA